MMPQLRKWGPFYLMFGATLGVMSDLVRHVLMDATSWFLVGGVGQDQRYNFHLGQCDYVVNRVAGGDSCVDRGVGPLLVQVGGSSLHMI